MRKINAPLFSLKFYISTVYYILGLLGNKKLNSVSLFEKSLKYYVSPGHAYLCYKTIGVVYYYNDFFEKAKYYLEKAEKFTGDEIRGDAELYTFIGLVYYADANFIVAKKYFKEALAKYRKIEWIKKDFIETHLHACEEQE